MGEKPHVEKATAAEDQTASPEEKALPAEERAALHEAEAPPDEDKLVCQEENALPAGGNAVLPEEKAPSAWQNGHRPRRRDRQSVGRTRLLRGRHRSPGRSQHLQKEPFEVTRYTSKHLTST